jgi:hypothetical protein
MAKKRSGRKGYGSRADMVTVMLTLERPSSEDLRGHGRADKYAALKSNASQIRSQLVEWIREQGLDKDVARVGEPTVFNTLFVTSTQVVADELRSAPGVVAVGPAEEFRVDLLSEAREAPPDETAAEDGMS